ncbi:MAG TPA: hypothetical protein P5079_07535 [Elusimicrobiota bacterium]|nr:hypothetical protein [Elusimicrobiota bacterium]
MKNFLILAALAILGSVLYFKFLAVPYGISSAAPLGDFDKLDSYLTQKLNLEKQPLQTLDLPGAEPSDRMFEYADTQQKYQIRETVILFTDKAGGLQGVSGAFVTPPAHDHQYRSKIQRFMRKYWDKVAGGIPVFTPTAFEREKKRLVGARADFVVGPVRGTWIKSNEALTLQFISLRRKEK